MATDRRARNRARKTKRGEIARELTAEERIALMDAQDAKAERQEILDRQAREGRFRW